MVLPLDKFPTILPIAVSSVTPSITPSTASEASSMVPHSLAPIPHPHNNVANHDNASPAGSRSPLLKHKEYQILGMLEYQPHDEQRFIKAIITGKIIKTNTPNR